MNPKARSRLSTVLGGLAAAILLSSCGGDDSTDPGAGLPQGSEHVELDPADFTTEIDNPYWPMTPGSRWVYRESDGSGADQKVVVEVTGRTKAIANGVEALVVRDTATENGRPVEITDDWYAQDAEGNIWYLGEDTAEYENGRVTSREGSFEAGVDGAEPGIVMPADPQPGMEYRQEYLEGEAEDEGAVVSVGDERVKVPYGYYDSDVLMTRDLVPLEPKVQELKFFAPGVGLLLAMHTDAAGREELVSYRPG